jgi:redox-sensitive bicupin YhaK (pirin superfamily)
MSIRETEEPAHDEERLPPGVAMVVEGRARSLGDFDVTRILPERRRRNVGPFVFLDHMGPVRLEPGHGMDVRPHPHIGLSTVTYLFEGDFVHRDSLGSVQTITPGAINLMTAGRGIVHSERSSPEARAAGAALHGVQIWLALPSTHEDGEPTFHHHPADTLPAWREDAVGYRLLLGAFGAYRSPVADPSRPLLLDVVLDAGASVVVPAEIAEAAVYVIEGELDAGIRAFGPRQLVVRAPAAELRLTAVVPTRALVLGGPALDAPRLLDWNFVASSRDRIERAKDAWRAQTFAKIPGDDQEFVPLP